jgi:hypothetical protein
MVVGLLSIPPLSPTTLLSVAKTGEGLLHQSERSESTHHHPLPLLLPLLNNPIISSMTIVIVIPSPAL